MKNHFETFLCVPEEAQGVHFKIANLDHFLDIFGEKAWGRLTEDGERLMDDIRGQFFEGVANGRISMHPIGSYSDNKMADFEYKDMYYDECGQLVVEYEFLSTIFG